MNLILIPPLIKIDEDVFKSDDINPFVKLILHIHLKYVRK
jgi:hypothetical protein